MLRNGSDKAFSWNPRAHQPHRTMGKWRRNAEFLAYAGDHLRLLWHNLRVAPRVMRRYRERLPLLFTGAGRPLTGFGIGTDPDPKLLERLADEVSSLGADCLLVRVPVWDLEVLGPCRAFLEEMRRRGISTVAAVLQDRRSVTEPDYWRRALEKIFDALEGTAGHFEIGHAWNRIKWGVRSSEEYLDLVEAAEDLRSGRSSIKFAGPAAIDFEYLATVGILHHHRRPRFDAVSQLLYVDRRGAPENTQSGFDLSHKALLFRAAVDTSLGHDVPFWITETNWPLAVPGEYSPTSMRESVDPERHADYLARYYLLALASGCVDRVFWWQLAAHGYGLVDDLDGRWVRRPAWRAFRFLASLLKDARLAGYRQTPGVRALDFDTVRGERVTAAWAPKGMVKEAFDFPVAEVLSRDGERTGGTPDGEITLGQSPVYLLHRG